MSNRLLPDQVIAYGRLVKFSHSVFALPFGLAAVILVQREYDLHVIDFFWIIIAMVSARSAAMGFNRIVDYPYDAKNPRTSSREIPKGDISVVSAGGFVVISSVVFIFSAAFLGKLCLYFSIPVLLILLSYSFTKRFTWLSHVYLGFAISLAPIGVWIAIAKSLSWKILPLSLALLTMFAGFDILYACRDREFDEKEGLFSIPVKFGISKSLAISKSIHVMSFIFFASLIPIFEMGWGYAAALVCIGGLLIIEHLLVDPDDLSRVHVAFFHVNSAISLTLIAGVVADEILRKTG